MKKKKMRALLVELEQNDQMLLRAMARHCDEPLAVIVRWALRHYALCGPWSIGSNSVRESVVEPRKGYIVGPLMKEMQG